MTVNWIDSAWKGYSNDQLDNFFRSVTEREAFFGRGSSAIRWQMERDLERMFTRVKVEFRGVKFTIDIPDSEVQELHLNDPYIYDPLLQKIKKHIVEEAIPMWRIALASEDYKNGKNS